MGEQGEAVVADLFLFGHHQYLVEEHVDRRAQRGNGCEGLGVLAFFFVRRNGGGQLFEGGVQITWRVMVEVDGQAKPCLAADWLTIAYY